MNLLKSAGWTAFLFIGCMSACNDFESESISYSTEKKSLACEMERLKEKTDSLWNGMAQYLDENLPADMPPAERANMVNIKNANLITMFKLFPKLDTAIQNKVRRAGKEDEKIAAEMKAVMDRLHKAERNLNQALEKLESQDKNKFREVKQTIGALEKLPCNQ